MAASFDTVDEYLASLPKERRSLLAAVRKTVLAHLPEGYVEQMQGGLIGYVVPHSFYPAGYHCDPRQPLQYAALASQKHFVTLHLMNVYGDPETEQWFRGAYQATGKRLNMGKACVRFKKMEDIPFEVIGQVIARTPPQAYVARIAKFLQSRPIRWAKGADHK